VDLSGSALKRKRHGERRVFAEVLLENVLDVFRELGEIARV